MLPQRPEHIAQLIQVNRLVLILVEQLESLPDFLNEVVWDILYHFSDFTESEASELEINQLQN